jgi:hypothetical protein
MPPKSKQKNPTQINYESNFQNFTAGKDLPARSRLDCPRYDGSLNGCRRPTEGFQ